MRNKLFLSLIILVAFCALLFYSVPGIEASADGLGLISPSSCPTGGCAAGQRLNFLVEFSVSPTSANPNTQICIYTSNDGISGASREPWANYTNGWISEKGLLTSKNYTEGETNLLCTNNTKYDDTYLAGAYAQLPAQPTSDQLEFALHINRLTDIEGYIRVKVFQTASGGTPWVDAGELKTSIPVAKISTPAYVGQNPADCGSNSPCFVNSGDDKTDGVGTGLRDAVSALDENAQIQILNDYTVKDNTILIDKKLNISSDGNGLITYIGGDCSQPMLRFSSGGSLKNLTINDGNCSTLSRDLIVVNSSLPVTIENNTLAYGNQAVNVLDNKGNVTIAFNHIANNQSYAVARALGTSSGQVKIYANNILNNGTDFQLNCNNRGIANHNYWGDSVSALTSVEKCIVSNSKRLGAPILPSPSGSGVEAVRKNVTWTMGYAFDGKIGVRRTSGENFYVIIVNHGQGNESNIPFYQPGSESISACSNFYDVFLAEDSAASNLVVSFKYNLNSECISTIESTEYCLSSDSSKYPLWWYDPENKITDGWDRTGQNPQGPGAGGASGQETICDIERDEIRVIIDNSGRPGISNDLSFTPLVVGLPFEEGVTLSQFTAQLNVTSVDLKWITTSERNVKGFHILRSETESGPYTRISPLIESIGETYIGGMYYFTDVNITYTKTYYYQLEVINQQGETIHRHGPVSVLTSTATPTITLTHTPTLTRTPTITGTAYPTRTSTTYYYRSPTSRYVPRTPTPTGGPTRVRTYRVSPTATRTSGTKPTYDPTGWITNTLEPYPGYPIEETATSLPVTAESTTTLSVTLTPTPGTEVPDQGYPGEDGSGDGITPERQEIRWVFLLVGIFGGIGVLVAASVLLANFLLRY